MQMDSVACDLSRALGSIVHGDKSRWESAINDYSQIRPLTQQEIDLIYILDQPSAFLGALNWLKWLMLENRAFESEADVKLRIMDLTGRLEAAL
jgi:Ser/Thr protein kinase RdoA (MazF antagonist)